MNKIKAIQQELEARELDALIITNPLNRRYVSQFTGTAGVVIVGKHEAVFITDFRYVEQAKEQTKGFKIIEHTEWVGAEINKQLNDMKAKRVGFEQDTVTYSTYDRFKKNFAAELVPTANIVEDLRKVKSDEEIAIMQEAAKIADDAFEHIKQFIKAGVSEREIAMELEFFMRKQGAASSSFDIIVASGFRSALPHGVATDKLIASGELVTLDFGAVYNDYCSDITRTVAVGEISEQLTDIYQTVLVAQEKGVQEIGPGITGHEADAIPRNYITDKGYGEYFGHSTGHGVGLDVHEEPRLSKASTETLKCGMVVTVEPGIYIPNVGGCRIEDELVITENGNKRLTQSSKELIHL